MSDKVKLIDIGVNLTDSMYQGEYHGSKKHQPDLDLVLDRAWKHGLDRMMVTGGSLEDAKEVLKICQTSNKLFATVGCHPTRCKEFEEYANGGPEGYLNELRSLIEANKEKIVAIGECGLDYDRLNFCPAETQKKYFEAQLDLSQATKLPLFLHCRAAANDLLEILKANQNKLEAKGVVHSFDGSLEQAQEFINLGFFIGINGCSLKTEENLKVAQELPVDKLMIETDAPWCEIRPTHASSKFVSTTFPDLKVAKKPDKWSSGGLVKGRNEPIFIHQVLDVIAALKDADREEVGQEIYKNTMKMFWPKL